MIADVEPIHIHPGANGFSQAVEAYASGRPDYPAALTAWLGEALRLGAGKTAVDLGSGTGKFLPRLLETGASVFAVEPVAAMRAKLAGAYPAADVREGTAESLPLETGSVDAVTCAQSFHWFANSRALREIGRVLKPGGRLGLIWNLRDESVPWVAKLVAIIDRYRDDRPRHETGAWRALFPGHGFGPLAETRFRHVHQGPPESVIFDRVLSVSFIATLPEDERAAITDRLRALVAETPELAGKREVRFPYETIADVAEKLA